LHHRYFSDIQELTKPPKIEDVLKNMANDGFFVSQDEYVTAHKKAVKLMDSALWGYTSMDSIDALGSFVPGATQNTKGCAS